VSDADPPIANGSGDRLIRRDPITAGEEIAAIALTAVTNVAANRFLPEAGYIPATLGTAALLTWYARRAGATWDDMGMDPAKVRAGLKDGLKAAVPIAGVVALGVALPLTRRFFLDEQIVSASTGEALYKLLIEIPIGTALAEELLFRGALLGLFERRHSRRVADAMSGLMYGLWHVLPTLEQLDTNPAGDMIGGTRNKALAVAGVVAVTTIAGYGFAWLRDRSKSVAAPVVAHTALNSFAYLGGRIAAALLR
jgi:membrane protease YdiL (CAAX protease family)